MSDTTPHYLVEVRGFLGRPNYYKCAGTPFAKSVNGGGTRTITRQVAITADDHNNKTIDQLRSQYMSKEQTP